MHENADPGPGPGSGRKGRMQNLDELRRENELLRNRISRLTAASLRISAR